MKYAFMESSHQVASSFLSEKSLGSPALISVRHVVISLSGSGSDCSKVSSSLAVGISISGSGVEAGDCSGIVVMVRGRGSSGPANECHGVMFKSLQELCILHSLSSPDGLVVPG